jgi:hypothetical protein
VNPQRLSDGHISSIQFPRPLLRLTHEGYRGFGIWCNGSSPDFESGSLGSNPGIPAFTFVENIFTIF